MNQQKVSVTAGRGLGMRITKNPLMRSMSALASDMPPVAILVEAGAAGHPCVGRVAVHTNLWANVPVSDRHSWHLLSVTLNEGTEALRAWVHWPATMAERR